MSSIINKFRTFPQYFDVVNALEKLESQSNEITNGYFKAYGTDFKTFRNKQPTQLRPVLEKLNNAGIEEAKTEQNLGVAIQKLPLKMPELKARQEKLLAQFNDKQAKQEAAKKAADQLTKEETKLKTLQSKGKQADISKQETVVTNARKASESATEASKNADDEYSKADAENAKEFPLNWISLFKDCIDAQKESCNKYKEVGEQIYNAAQEITIFEDPAVPKLRQRLELWEQTQV